LVDSEQFPEAPSKASEVEPHRKPIETRLLFSLAQRAKGRDPIGNRRNRRVINPPAGFQPAPLPFGRRSYGCAFSQFIGAAADHHIAKAQVADHLDEVTFGRSLFHVYPFGAAVLIADDEGALGGCHHAGPGDEQRRAGTPDRPTEGRIHAGSERAVSIENVQLDRHRARLRIQRVSDARHRAGVFSFRVRRHTIRQLVRI